MSINEILAQKNITKYLWRNIMARVHEELPSEKFPIPEGIIQAEVCNSSGLLPIPGVCDGNTYTEYFADGTVPTESCSVHYQGDICSYDGLPAAPECPFKYFGVTTRALIEHEALIAGSTMIVENPDGTQSVVTPNTATQCQHDATFYLNPDADAIIESQYWELQNRWAAEEAAAHAATDDSGAE